MNALRLLATVTTAPAMLALSSTVSAAADPIVTIDRSEATLTVTGGTLDITVETTRGSLDKANNTAKERTLSGRLSEVAVTDRRAAPTGSR